MALRDVVVVGAGPSGLATAIAAKRLGLDVLVVERGTVAEGILRFPVNMVFFTTPEGLEIGGLPFTTHLDKPTRVEALRYYRKVSEAYGLPMALYEDVQEVSPEPYDGEPAFAVTTRDRHGVTRAREARTVVLAMGYYGQPNRLGVPGEDLPHVSHYYVEAHPYYRQRVVVVGGKNSACEAALELHRAGAHVTLVHRGETLGESVKYWVRPDIDNRIREGAIAARFRSRVVEIGTSTVTVDGAEGERHVLAADAVLLLTGYHADAGFLRQCGVALDAETLIPAHDPETCETNVPGLFIAGGQLAGRRTGSIFIENGRLHGEQIARAIAARLR